MDVGTKSYDPSGNMTEDSATGNTYLYDGEGRICAVSSTPVPGFTTMTGYVYDAEGNRVAKGTITSMSCDPSVNGLQTSNNETDYVLGPGGEQVTELAQDANGTMNWQRTYVYGAGGLIGTYDPDPDNQTQPLPSFRLTDWLGTLRATTDSYGVAQGTCTGLPFGDGVSCSGDIPDNHHFTGKERDPETGGLNGNDYFGARYYASSMARWLSPDWSAKVMPVPYAKLGDPQSLNLYAYVRNNPLSRIDADGHYEISCGSGSKNCNQNELDRINNQIAKDQVSKNKARAAAAGAYGGLGEKNGVIITVVDQPNPKNANVNGTTGAQAGTPGFAYTADGKATGVATAVTLKAGLDGGDLKDAVDHEGQHALDRKNYVDELMKDPTGESAKGLNITGRMSEVNAYTTQGLSPGEIKQQLSQPPYSTDPNIDKPLFPMPSSY